MEEKKKGEEIGCWNRGGAAMCVHGKRREKEDRREEERREDGVVEGCPPRRGKKGEKKKIKEEWGIRSKEWGCPFCFIIITLLKIRLKMRYPSKPTNG